MTRELPTDRTLLFVIDGAPGLHRGITDVFGSRGVVQRCQVHKYRNLLGHLPERLHDYVGKAQRLGLTGALQAKRCAPTNIIENLKGSVERYARNVKRWRGGQSPLASSDTSAGAGPNVTR